MYVYYVSSNNILPTTIGNNDNPPFYIDVIIPKPVP